MRVLESQRSAWLLVITAAVMAVALPASAGEPARSVAPAGRLAPRAPGTDAMGSGSHRPAAAPRDATKVVLGTAVAYVREPDGTVRQYR